MYTYYIIYIYNISIIGELLTPNIRVPKDMSTKPAVLRAYPSGFAQRVFDLHMQCRMKGAGLLRQKAPVDTSKTDRELFEELSLGDRWCDAGLVELFFYLLQSRTLEIPDSWVPTMQSFKAELESYAHQKQLTVRASWLESNLLQPATL